jgi:glutathione S-transferase
MSKPKITYFMAPGRAEPLRLALYISGMDFEDHRIAFPEFQNLKSSGALPYGSLPTFELDSKVYAQANAILRYIGKKTKLYPEDPLTALKVDELLSAADDITACLGPTMQEKDENKKKQMREKIGAEDFPKWFAFVEKRLKEFGNGPHAVGDTLTIADLKIGCMLMGLASGHIDYITDLVNEKSYPRMYAVRQLVENHGKVKEWILKHKK